MNRDISRSTLFLGRVKKNLKKHPKRNLILCLILSTLITILFAISSLLLNVFTDIDTPVVFIFFTIPMIEGILVSLSFGLFFDAIEMDDEKFSVPTILAGCSIINIVTYALTLILLVVLNLIF